MSARRKATPEKPREVLWEEQPAAVVLCLNRPAVHNAVNEGMMCALEVHLDELDSRPDIRVVILTAAGEESFCAGGDLRYFSTLNSRDACLEMSRRMQTILQRLSSGKRVVIAAVNGRALGGGCEILTACHFRLAVPEARFGFRQAANGIITGWGGGVRLMELLGRSRALPLLLTAESIDARRALEIGLVDALVERPRLLPAALELAERIMGNSAAALHSFLELAGRLFTESGDALRQWETARFADLWMGDDFRKFISHWGPDSR